MELDRHAAGLGHVQQRDRVRLAVRDVRQPGVGHGRHDLRRRVLRAQRPLLGDSRGFNAAVDNPPLHAVANASSANGLYAYSSTSTFPTSSFSASNYWVDVLFQPPAAAGPVTNVTATAGNASAHGDLDGAGERRRATSYTVTPFIGTTAQTPVTINGTPPATTTTITGLTAGTAYTFTVKAANANGTGPVSAHSNSVTPTGSVAPSAPTG